MDIPNGERERIENSFKAIMAELFLNMGTQMDPDKYEGQRTQIG